MCFRGDGIGRLFACSCRFSSHANSVRHCYFLCKTSRVRRWTEDMVCSARPYSADYCTLTTSLVNGVPATTALCAGGGWWWEAENGATSL